MKIIKKDLKNFISKKSYFYLIFLITQKIILSPRNLINIKIIEVSNAKKILNSLINIKINSFTQKLIDRQSFEKLFNDNLISKNKELHLITEKFPIK